MKLAWKYVVAAVAALLIGCVGTPQAAHPAAGSTEAKPFDGAWHVDWCEAGQTAGCGGFTAYLIQIGDRICGSHYGADARQNRMDEGAPSSIVGSARGGAANVQIRSGRNNGIYRARVVPAGGGLAWTTEAEERPGDNGEPAFVPDRDVLRRVSDADSVRILETVRAQCAAMRSP